MKICTKCGLTKELTDFYKDKRASDGRYSHCAKCQNAITVAYAKANPERNRESTAKWRKANPGVGKEVNAAWKMANRKRVSELQMKYAKANPGKINALVAARNACKHRAIPKWANRMDIRQLYETAIEISSATGILHHVDHIVPLQSKFVCGLHVSENLQVIPAQENLSKHNKYWPDMP